MGDLIGWQKLIEQFGVAALMLFVVWKLVDKWAARFLGAQEAQAKAMGDLAGAVKENSDSGREILLAMRVVAEKVDRQSQWIKQLDEHLSAGRIARGGE